MIAVTLSGVINVIYAVTALLTAAGAFFTSLRVFYRVRNHDEDIKAIKKDVKIIRNGTPEKEIWSPEQRQAETGHP